MADVIEVKLRETTGKRRNRRLRATGMVPAVLYGHGQGTVALSVPTKQLHAALRHAGQLVELRGAANESALISDTQWDTFGMELLHVDFTRVSADERVEVELTIELRGEAPGVKEGGVVEQLVREVQIECAAGNIPGKVELNINELQVDQTLYASDLQLPEGVKLISSSEEALVQCVIPVEEEEEEAEALPSEPEVIGRKEAEEGEGEGEES